MMRKNEVYSAVARELNAAGIDHVRSTRGKHEAVTFKLGSRTTTVIVPVSSSDWRAPRSARSFVRRVLRSGGAA